MSWVDDLKKRAAEKRDQAVRAAAEEYRRELSMIDELALRFESDGGHFVRSTQVLLEPARTCTEALREAFARLPGEFTKEQAFDYVREYYPSLARDLSSAFNKLRNKRGEIELVKPGHGNVPAVFRRAQLADPTTAQQSTPVAAGAECRRSDGEPRAQRGKSRALADPATRAPNP